MHASFIEMLNGACHYTHAFAILKVVTDAWAGHSQNWVFTHQIFDVDFLDQFLFIIDVVLRLATPLLPIVYND